MDINKISFVYYKNGKIKVLGHYDARRENDRLLSKGWVHTKNIDIHLWVEDLFNNLDDHNSFNKIYNLSEVE